MAKFKKILNSKILSFTVAMVFILTSTACAIELPDKSHLRAPLMSGSQQEEDRLEKTAKELDGGKTPVNARVKKKRKRILFEISPKMGRLALVL